MNTLKPREYALSEVETASAVARLAHFGQKDKIGRDYFEFHVQPVAEAVARAGARGTALHAAAFLHDVLEDCGGEDGFTERTLHVARLSRETIRLVVALTRRPDETYADYVERVSRDRAARVIKMADNRVNYDNLPLLREVEPLAAVRLERRYAAAWDVLEAAHYANL